ncbi:tyrosine-type recombinase/integrase [Candidatus Palauibacter sp.]|uniref:tyrosine-type recombinase/integrase n=1 Tax=Candidatus Palauibacter sp. TaxID=3101350 RepID=UPI003B52C966
MARTKRSRRSYSAGEWGRNRVRVFPDPKTGLFQIEWRENGRRLTRSLGHRDWTRAKRQADEFAAGFASPDLNGEAEAAPAPLTLEKLFDIYGEEVTPSKTKRVRHRDRVGTRMFLDFLGRDRRPETLSQRDWDRFIRERRAGRIGPSGKPVSNRTIELDLRFLIAVLNWATKSRDEEGRLLLVSNPLRGLRTPKEKNPSRVVLSEEEYHAMLGVSRQVDWRFHVAFVLAHETGHRIGAIRNLRWGDIDFEGREVRWRAEHEKTGYEHVTPMTDEAVATLEKARGSGAGTGNAPVLPSSRDATRGVQRASVFQWWRKAETLAGLEPKPRRGWHSLRRKFASDLMDLPLKVLCELGGWRDAQTVLRCYQRPDAGQLRTALEGRRGGSRLNPNRRE